MNVVHSGIDCPVTAAPDRSAFEPLVIQPAYVERNARELAGAMLPGAAGEARTLLHSMLNEIQPDPYTWREGASEPALQFDDRDGLSEAVLRRIMVVDALPSSWQIEGEARQECRSGVQTALGTLRALDPAMYRSVNTVLAAVLFGRLDHFGGGSNSSAIGCVWLNPRPSWTDMDWLENIFHEYIHQCLFIDDMRHGLFRWDGEVLAGDEALVRSALLKTPRPYDRAFHSSFVSFGLMQLDLWLKRPERIAPHLEPLRVTIDLLLDSSRYLTPHALRLLESLRVAFAAFRAVLPLESAPC